VIYEMITGKRAFEGSSSASLVAAILDREPVPLATEQPLTPPSLERLVRRCLAKSPDDRWDSAHDVADELRWIAESGPRPAPAPVGPATHGRRGWLLGGALALALASGLVGSLLGRRSTRDPVDRGPVVRSALEIRPAEEVNAGGLAAAWLRTPGGSRTALAWTPDGRSLVFVGRRDGVQRLYVRALDAEESRPLEGTEGAQAPAVSPDGRWVAFWASGAIRRVPLAGGPATVLVDGVPAPPFGIAIGEDQRVFYNGPGRTIWSAEPERPPAALTKRLDNEFDHLLPHVLPGGRALLFVARHRRRTWGDEEVVAYVLGTGERKALLRDAADARYVPSGHLVFLRRGTLFGVGFDLDRLEVRGTPVPMLDAVTQALTSPNTEDATGAGHFSVSSNGTLAYIRGPVVPNLDFDLVSLDRQGRISRLDAPTRSYRPCVALSPDGRQLALVTLSLTETSLWLHEIGSGTLAKLPGTGEMEWVRWTPDGHRVAVSTVSQGAQQLAWQRTDGTAPPELLVAVDAPPSPSSWSPDGTHLALVKNQDIWIGTLRGGTATVVPLSQTPELEWWPEFSPDGRWLAYGSNVSGRFEIYIQPYPGPGPRKQVSLEGGESPAWNPAGGEVLFLSPPDSAGKRAMMAAPVHLSPSLSAGRPQRLFALAAPPLRPWANPSRCFAVAPDGQHFYMAQVAPAAPLPPVTQIQLVQNWVEELKARVPAGPIR
jgi:serine/threonine-protein kinase